MTCKVIALADRHSTSSSQQTLKTIKASKYSGSTPSILLMVTHDEMHDIAEWGGSGNAGFLRAYIEKSEDVLLPGHHDTSAVVIVAP